jgi:hypothetical protein
MSRLVSFVHVRDQEGGYAVFGPDDEDIPGWALEQMGDHCFEGGERPDTASSSDGPPPKAGKGSSVDAWSAFASAKGVDIEPDAKRDDIIAALEAAGVPTE